MFEELDDLKAHLDTLRPIDTDKMMAVQEKLRIDWTYNTNAIEGNTLTLQETAFFLREGLTSKGKPLSEFLEAKNHVEAISFLEEVVKENRPLTERLIKDFHAIVMQDSKYVWIGPTDNRVKKRIEPGNYKYDNNHVVKLDGTIHFYTDHLQVPGEMENLIKRYEENKEKVHPVELAAGLHHKFVAIHPFTDGNGRVARLVMNLVLMQAGYLPAIIKNEDRMEYYSALDTADKGDYAPFINIVERETFRTMKMVVDVIEGREAFGKEDLKKMVKGFIEKTEKLDKDIKVKSRDNYLAKEILDYIELLVRNIVSEEKNFFFDINPNVKLSNPRVVSSTSGIVTQKGIEEGEIETRTIYDCISLVDDREKKDGVLIQIKSRKIYLPPAKYSIHIIQKIDGFYLIALQNIQSLEFLNENVTEESEIINQLKLKKEWDKSNTEEVDIFFINTFKEFLKSVENEVESRRRQIGRKSR